MFLKILLSKKWLYFSANLKKEFSAEVSDFTFLRNKNFKINEDMIIFVYFK